MNYVDPHVHMVSRTTDDYQKMACSGCQMVSEPAFWAGFDRSTAHGFYDYFTQLTQVEPTRAAQFGIRHYCWLCINPKEAEDLTLAREVLRLIPEFLDYPTVLGIGEIGLNKNTVNEIKIFEEHVELALKYNQLILIHTPHLEDKKKGTRLIVDILRNFSKINPSHVLVDHMEEHTIQMVIDAGFWAGLTLYPETKCSIPRAADIVEIYGDQRIVLNSACDWGNSDPLAVPKAALELRMRGHTEKQIENVTRENALRFFAQSPKFK